MESPGVESVRELVAREAGRCAYCGFCEAVCPTAPPLGPHRGYTPRGRVLLARLLAEGRVGVSVELLSSLYTCTLCGACMEACPAQLDIVEVVRLARSLAAARLTRAALGAEHVEA